MNNRSRLARVLSVAAFAAVVALLAAGPAPAASSSSALQIEGYRVDGNVMYVVVSNPTSDPASGWVVAVVKAGGEEVTGMAPVQVMPGQSATVTLGFLSQIDQVISLGMTLDNPDPIS